MGGIKYPPKYYNPNWPIYSNKRIRWEKAHKKSTKNNNQKININKTNQNNNK